MKSFLALDIGGTFLKATIFDLETINAGKIPQNVIRVPSLVNQVGGLKIALRQLAGMFENYNVASIGISTPGIVDGMGEKVVLCAQHLKDLRRENISQMVSEIFNASASLINDADAALIGAFYYGIAPQKGSTALIAIGTGIGCAIACNGHLIRPNRNLPLLGAIETPLGSFDKISSAVELEKRAGISLVELFQIKGDILEEYLNNVALILDNAFLLYSLDTIVLCGGLVAAAEEASYPLADELMNRINPQFLINKRANIVASGAKLQLLGAAALAQGAEVLPRRILPKLKNTITEKALYPNVELNDLSDLELISTLSSAEVLAGNELNESIVQEMSKLLPQVVERLKAGGRLIYVGAGTSGRIGAIDAVELPCTYGIEDFEAIALIAGGNTESLISIERNGEEDFSSIPELLLLKLNENDIVIAISASGSAYYVRSALAYAHQVSKSLTIIIQATNREQVDADYTLSLSSGSEVVAGSTRMKAGTATKKIINFLSTAAMIRLGHTKKSQMIHMQLLNEKLLQRHKEILVDSL